MMLRTLTFLHPWKSPEIFLKHTGYPRTGISEKSLYFKAQMPKDVMSHVTVYKIWTWLSLKGKEVRVQVQGSSGMGKERTEVMGQGPSVTPRKKRQQQWGLGKKCWKLLDEGRTTLKLTSKCVCSPGLKGSSHSMVRIFQCIQWPTAMGKSTEPWNPKPSMGKGWKSTPCSPGNISSISLWREDRGGPWRAFRQALWAGS